MSRDVAQEEGFPSAGALDGSARLLALGSFPSLRSQEKQEYYGYERNHFWPLLFSLAAEKGLLASSGSPGTAPSQAEYSRVFTGDYEEKLCLAVCLNMMIWDMAKICRRATSADDALEIVELNDIAALLRNNPSIERIGLNGARASELFLRTVVGEPDRHAAKDALSHTGGRIGLTLGGKRREVYRLPSTSPVPTRHYRTIEDKKAPWRKFLY